MSKHRCLASTVAATIALCGFGAAPALAGQDQKIVVTGGLVEFTHTGEVLTASDTNPSKRGGIRAYLTWADENGDGDFAMVTSYSSDPQASSVNLSIREGTVVTLMACYVDDEGDVGQCSKGQKGVA